MGIPIGRQPRSTVAGASRTGAEPEFRVWQPLADESTNPDLLHSAAIEGGRPRARARPPVPPASDLRLFGNFEGVIDLDAEVPHGGFQFGVP